MILPKLNSVKVTCNESYGPHEENIFPSQLFTVPSIPILTTHDENLEWR